MADRSWSGGIGAALDATVHVVNHDVPTDPVALRGLRLKQADDAIESARRKIIKQRQHIEGSTGARRKKLQAHLADAEQALAEAIAAKQRLADRPATE